MKTRPLYMHEEVLLLALCDEKGTLHSGAWLQPALAGAILAEFLSTGRIRLEKEGKQEVVAITRDNTFGDNLLDDCLEKIRSSSKRHTVQHWSGLIGCRGDLMPGTAEGLCRIGVLRTDEKKVLLIFSLKIYPEIDPKPEAELLDRMRAVIFDDSAEVDTRTTMLIAIAHRTGLLRANFDKGELKRCKERIEGIAKGEFAGEAAQGAINAQSAAFLLTTMMPLIMMPTMTGR